MIKICAISDMHGLQEFIHIEECDILCICGDIVPLKMQTNIPQSMSWFKKTFIPWCEKQPCKQIYLVAGNHDFFMENKDKELNDALRGTKIIYLNNQSAEYLDEESGKIYSIWGSPLCHIFGSWAFMRSPEYELEKFSLMPKNCDIVLCHDAPYGVSDICMQNTPWNKHEHIGNPELTATVIGKEPKLLLHGHLHSTNHDCEKLDNTDVYNVSVVDERYEIAYNPLYLDIQ